MQDNNVAEAWKPSLLRWVADAIKKIGFYPKSTSMLISEIEVDCERIDYPEDMAIPYQVFLRTKEGNIIEAPRVGMDVIRHKIDNCFPFAQLPSVGMGVLRDTGSYWFLENKEDAKNYDRAYVIYFGVPRDDDGNPLIPFFYEAAVTAYLELNWEKQLRKQDRRAVNANDIEFAMKVFDRAAYEARARSNMPNMMEMREAALSIAQRRIFNTLPTLK